tara:strand:- start:4782 stop:6089 length:1308 start_codon:yes stop_codon:yes gene_type:complete
MANLITQSLTFSKESVTEYFLKPLFLQNDIRDIITIRTDIQGSEKLDYIDSLRKITKGYQRGTSFTTSTGVTVTQRTVLVTQMKAQVAQSGDQFLGWVKEEALKKGTMLNDINGTIFEEIVLAIYVKALAVDLQRQAFMGDTVKEAALTGVLDADYKEYVGFWSRIITDFKAVTIPAAQRVVLANGAVKQVGTTTLTGTSGTSNITINGVAYLATFNSSLTQTAADFVTSHASTIAAREYSHVLTSSAAGVILTSGVEGVAFDMSASVNVTGDLAGNNVATTANTLPADLGTDEAETAFKDMIKAIPAEMKEFKSEIKILCTDSMAENYRETLEADGTEQAHTKLIEGIPTLYCRGYEIVVREEWDADIAADFVGYYPHRALLTLPRNLVWATDLNAAASDIESWYNQDNQERNFRTEYKAGTQYIHTNYIVAAY